MLMIGAIIYYLLYLPNCRKEQAISIKNDADKHSQLSGSVQINAEENNTKIVKRKARLYYLDNLKAFLTAIVVIHHITCSFQGNGWIYMVGQYYNPFLILSSTITAIDQSYFMCLFFFISGYFTPSSYDKKGVTKFLSDKLKRLGIPFLVYTLILGPALNLFNNKVLVTGNDYSYFPDDGPCWFLAWLLIFNVCYVIYDQNVPIYIMQFPSFTKLLIIGAVIGFIQILIFIIVPGGYLFMPIFIGSLPFNIVFFTAGVIANRNKWLSFESPLISSHVILMRILTILCTLIFVGVFAYGYMINIGNGFYPKKGASQTDCDSDDDNYDTSDILLILVLSGMFIFAGICCMVYSVTFIQWAASYWNYTNAMSKFLSEQAYAVYLIHPLIICPALWSFIQLLHIFGGPEIKFCHNSTISKTHFGHNYLVYVGWIYTMIVSLIIVWPTAWCLRQIPGFKRVI